MENLMFRIGVLTATFFIGLGAFILSFFYLNSVPEITAPDASPAPQKYEKECLQTSFPGLSKKISEIRKGQSGYFPRYVFGNDMSPKGSVAGWYGGQLKAMGEESLLDTKDDAEIYRFLWLRSFGHPIFVRVVRSQNRIKLFTKELEGTGGYAPGKILRSEEIDLNEEAFVRFLNLLEEANYWDLPIDDKEGGNDGAQWILEGVKNGRYHIVDRWTPQSGAYREACLYLLKLSGVDLDRLQDDLY